MNADFFFTSDEAYGSDRVARLLKTYVDPDITLATWGLDTLESNARFNAGRRYAQLLAASLPPEKGLTIEVKELIWGERRVYVSVYWPVFVSEYGQLSYTYAGTHFFPFNPGLGIFFPALAIHDRMVLVPMGQTETLGQLGPSEPDAGQVPIRDIREVDFRDPDQLEAAIREAGQRLREELWQNFRAYSLLSRGDMTSLHQVAETLGVSPAVLEETIRSRTTERADAYRALACSIEPTQIVQGRWQKLTLRLGNPNAQPLGRILVTVSGPAQALPASSRVDLTGAAEAAIPVSVKADDVGEFPLEIALSAEDEGLPLGSMPAYHVWLESIPAEQGQP